MGLTKIFLAICCTGLILSHVSQAQRRLDNFVDAHNVARAEVGVPPLTWNTTVAAYARNYAYKRIKDCQLVHSNGPYGENLAYGGAKFRGVDAVRSWVDEKPNYNYESNTCINGACLHYTQVVWADSVYLGCAKVKCNDNRNFFTCNYDPPGNYRGERPYLKK